MTVSAVEKELVKATGVKAAKYDERPLFLEAVFDAAQELPQEKWDNISQEARDWLTAFGDAFNANQELPDFDHAESSDEDTSDEDGSENEDENEDSDPEDTVKTTTKKTSSKKTAAKKPAAAKSGKTAKKPAAAKPEKAAKTASKSGKTTKKPAAKTASKPRGGTDSARFVLGRIICKDPNAPVESLMTALDKAGHELSKVTVTTLRSDFRFLLRVMKAEGINPAKVEI